MSNEASPRPWKTVGTYRDIIVGADGVKVCELYGELGTQQENASLICDAVNLHDVTRNDRHALQEANELIALLEAEHDELCDAVRKLLPRASFLNGYFLGKHASADPDDAETAAEDFDNTSVLIEEIERLVNHNPERNPKQ